ncbi:VOC family protein [Amycolatopsis sp. GM8]|uniref:VOC family protein n=1 Tax=Amycolatopsis sp. GM8 TaxID=2896530 RepID=UPI001F2B49AD|nr:VOC family protein [Amycolatopsis sp. GM8]
MTQPTVWPALRFDDAPAAIRIIVDVFGFREALVVPGEGGHVQHAELRWPEGGGVMLGSTKCTDGTHADMKPGVNAVYVVTDDVDAVHDRVTKAGLDIDEPLHDTEFGSHTFTARDPEGNQWTFGTYRGAP